MIRKGVAVDFPAVNGGIPICKDFLKVIFGLVHSLVLDIRVSHFATFLDFYVVSGS